MGCHVEWLCVRLSDVAEEPAAEIFEVSLIYVVCPKSKCTDFPMDELVM